MLAAIIFQSLQNPANPFRGPYNESDLDSPQHRALAREAMAASVVLLQVSHLRATAFVLMAQTALAL
jgi:hypothetical protein